MAVLLVSVSRWFFEGFDGQAEEGYTLIRPVLSVQVTTMSPSYHTVVAVVSPPSFSEQTQGTVFVTRADVASISPLSHLR